MKTKIFLRSLIIAMPVIFLIVADQAKGATQQPSDSKNAVIYKNQPPVVQPGTSYPVKGPAKCEKKSILTDEFGNVSIGCKRQDLTCFGIEVMSVDLVGGGTVSVCVDCFGVSPDASGVCDCPEVDC